MGGGGGGLNVGWEGKRGQAYYLQVVKFADALIGGDGGGA